MYVCEREGGEQANMHGAEMVKVKEFKYQGSAIQRQCARWVKKSGSQVEMRRIGQNHDRTIEWVSKVKRKLYKKVVRCAMMFGLEMVAITKRQEHELNVLRLETSMCEYKKTIIQVQRIFKTAPVFLASCLLKLCLLSVILFSLCYSDTFALFTCDSQIQAID